MLSIIQIAERHEHTPILAKGVKKIKYQFYNICNVLVMNYDIFKIEFLTSGNTH